MKINVGDRVKCIDNNGGGAGLTIGRVYIVKDVDGGLIHITNDNGVEEYYFFFRFELAKGLWT